MESRDRVNPESFISMGRQTNPSLTTVASENETMSRLFVRGLSVIMAWRLVTDFRAQVRFRLGPEDEPEESFILEARPRELKYAILSENGDVRERFDGYAHTVTRDGTAEVIPTHNLTPESLVARLAFPMSLSIWDRSVDDYRFTGEAVQIDDEMQLGLVHRSHPGVTGGLTVNTRLRMLVKRETPTQFLAYEKITGI